MGLGASALASAAAYELLAGPARALAAQRGRCDRPAIGYFGRFGVDQELIRVALGGPSRAGATSPTSSSSTGSPTPTLEDGAVNRAFADVDLGVGVRVVKGDQTGYGFTEDLTPRA